MKLQWSMAAKAVLVLTALLSALFTGCSSPAVGDPCLPEQVPETGFDERETYIESSSVQCQTRVCIVYRLAGDPRETCVPGAGPLTCPEDDPDCIPSVKCAEASDVDDHIYCSCRCNSGSSGFAECECPSNYTCVDVLEQGGPGIAGGYCVKTKTVSK